MLGAVDRGHVVRIVEALAASDGAALVRTVDELRGLGLSAAGTLEELATFAQQMALVQAVPDAADPTDPDTPAVRALAPLLAPDETQVLYSIALHGRAELALAPDEYRSQRRSDELNSRLDLAPRGLGGSVGAEAPSHNAKNGAWSASQRLQAPDVARCGRSGLLRPIPAAGSALRLCRDRCRSQVAQQAECFCVPLASAIERSLQRCPLDLAVVLDALQRRRMLGLGELGGVLGLGLYGEDALLCGLERL